MLSLLIVIIVIALLFDLVNGFHDAANSIATVVSTKVLTPFQAVVWAAVFNFAAFWVFDMSVGWPDCLQLQRGTYLLGGWDFLPLLLTRSSVVSLEQLSLTPDLTF
jgi:hypothetical protein